MLKKGGFYDVNFYVQNFHFAAGMAILRFKCCTFNFGKILFKLTINALSGSKVEESALNFSSTMEAPVDVDYGFSERIAAKRFSSFRDFEATLRRSIALMIHPFNDFVNYCASSTLWQQYVLSMSV